MANGESNNNSFERHTQTALTSLIVLLLAGLVGVVFSNTTSNSQLTTSIEVLQYQVAALADDIRATNNNSARDINRLEVSYNTLWPRLRATSENIEILRQKIEAVCDCDILLNDPEPF